MHECDAILVDLDTNRKQIEKFIKSVHKAEEPKSVIALCNSLEGRELQKHQNSRHAADIYLTYPMEVEVLKMMIEESLNSKSSDSSSIDHSFAINFEEKEVDSKEDELINLDESAPSDGDDLINLSEDDPTSLIDLSSDDEGAAISLSEADEDSASLDLSEADDDLSLGDSEDELSLGDSTEGDEAASAGELDLSFDGNSELEDSLQGQSEDFDMENPGELDLGAATEEEGSQVDDSPVGEMSLGGFEVEEEDDAIAPNLDEASDDDDIGELEFSIDEEEDEDKTKVISASEVNPEQEEMLDEIEFGVEGDQVEEKTQAFSQVSDDEDDDFQTKLREIDEMLKEDTSSDVTKNIPEELKAEEKEEPEAGFSIDEEDATEVAEEYQYAAEEDQSEELDDYTPLSAQGSADLVRLGETIKSLRLDREQLLKKITHLEQQQHSQSDNLLTMQAQLDEKKIENSIMKKRYSKQIEDLNVKLEMIANKKEVLEEKNKQMESQFLKLRKEKSFDVNRIRSRERELEDKLELLRKDTEVQIRNRDQKILELKRRIDTLEFDVESAYMKEKQSVTQQTELEEKMFNVVSTLRSAIGQLEEDSAVEKRKKRIKKNLDV